MNDLWSSFVAIFQKEFVHMRRDRATLVIALTIPLFQLVLFGFIDQTVSNLPTVVVDQDGTRYARELMDKLRATRTFKITHVTPDPRLGRDDIAAGRARVGVVIPPDFHDTRALGTGSKILVLIDGSRNICAICCACAWVCARVLMTSPIDSSEKR